LFPSRTDEEIDDESIEGNIRNAAMTNVGTPSPSKCEEVSVSLRTDSDPSEIVGVFALDGNGVMGDVGDAVATDDAFIVLLSSVDDSDVDITMSINTDSDINIATSYYRVFDEDGEAIEDWALFYQSDDDDSYTISDTGPSDLTITYTLEGITDRSSIADWNVIIIYEDDAGDAYILRESAYYFDL
jgi:hypothetical protein